ncbi:MAG: methyltransferase domain-containing protein, partial [Gammaproteobacteria bacterium]|nr:methyltransferase domain-containing protein [Gammaproteobacteria bacterium]
MKKIEPVCPKITKNTKNDINTFWERNVNAEEILGKKISSHKRGGDDYFSELEEQRYRTHSHILPWIQQMEGGRSVLEIGCGIGMDSYQLAKRGLNVTGIDLTKIAIETAKKRFDRKGIVASFEVGDATNLKFENESFDYVYSFGVLHHTQNTEASIQEVYRVLRKGGVARI